MTLIYKVCSEKLIALGVSAGLRVFELKTKDARAHGDIASQLREAYGEDKRRLMVTSRHNQTVSSSHLPRALLESLQRFKLRYSCALEYN